MILLLLVVAACVGVVAWMSAAETACFSLSRVELRRLAASGARGRVLARLLDDPPRVLTTILVVNTAASVAASAAAVSLLRQVLTAGHSTVVLVDAVVTSLAILIFGEITPKSLAVHHAEPIALAVAPGLAAVGAMLRPVTGALSALAAAIARRVRAPERRGDHTADLVATIEAGGEEGVLASSERQLLLGALAYGRRTAGQVMRPWPRVLTIPEGTTARDAVGRLRAQRVSRAPLVGTNGAVRGIVRVQDLLPLVLNGHADHDAREVLRPAFFVPPETTLTHALRAVRRDRTYVLVVAGDPARPLGLVTLRDLIEELLQPVSAGAAPHARRGRRAEARA